MQNDMGRWLWQVGMNVANACVRGETGWSTFAEREAKVKLEWVLRVIYEDSMVSKVGRASLSEVGTSTGWWARVRYIYVMRMV